MFHETHTITELLLTLVAIPVGMLVHECSHWILGRIFGGRPFFSEYLLDVFPHQTDFETPREMDSWQVKMLGGFPFAFAALTLLPVWHHAIILAGFFAGIGFTTSATDMIALYHPEMWLDLAAGESVTRDYLE